MIHLNRGNLLYWLATLGGYVEDARTENLFDFGFHVMTGILVLLIRTILILFALFPLLLSVYWLGDMAYHQMYIVPYDVLKFGWYLYGLAFILAIIVAFLQSVMCPSPTSKLYKIWRVFSKFFFRIKTNKTFAISFLNRNQE